jgi:hypothetical protein
LAIVFLPSSPLGGYLGQRFPIVAECKMERELMAPGPETFVAQVQMLISVAYHMLSELSTRDY